jgi:hypothetical protein
LRRTRQAGPIRLPLWAVWIRILGFGFESICNWNPSPNPNPSKMWNPKSNPLQDKYRTQIQVHL